MDKKVPLNVDEYISGFPAEVQDVMKKVREVIHNNAPEATEGISWSMPTFRIKKILVQFAGHKNHLGFYPFPETIEHFKEQLTDYKTSKGGIQFPYHQPVPYDLIGKLVRYNAGNLRAKEEK